MSAPLAEIEDNIREGRGDACLVDWAPSADLFGAAANDPIATISAIVQDFKDAGWREAGNQLVKDGWCIWFRSQGQLAPPIAQWKRIAAT